MKRFIIAIILIYLLTACDSATEEIAGLTEVETITTNMIAVASSTSIPTATTARTPGPTVTGHPGHTRTPKGIPRTPTATLSDQRFYFSDPEAITRSNLSPRAYYLWASENILDQAEWLLACTNAGDQEDECGWGMFIPEIELPRGALCMQVLGLSEYWPRLVNGDPTLAEDLPGGRIKEVNFQFDPGLEGIEPEKPSQSEYFLENLNRYSGLNPNRYEMGAEYCVLTHGIREAFPEVDFGQEMCLPENGFPCDTYLIFGSLHSEPGPDDPGVAHIFEIYLGRGFDPINVVRSDDYYVWITPSDMSMVEDNTPEGTAHPILDTIFKAIDRGANEVYYFDYVKITHALFLIQTSSEIKFFQENYTTVYWVFN